MLLILLLLLMLIMVLMLMLRLNVYVDADIVTQAEAPAVPHFGAYHRPSDGHFLHRRSTGYLPSLNFPQPTSQILDPLHGWESFRAGFSVSTWEWLTAAKMPRWNFCHKLWKNMGNILCGNRFLLASGSMSEDSLERVASMALALVITFA